MSDQENQGPVQTPVGETGNPTPPAQPQDISIGKVFSLTFSILFKNFHRFIGLSAMIWIPSIALVFLFPALAGNVVLNIESGGLDLAAFILFFIAFWLLTTWLYGSVTHLAYISLADGVPSVMASFKAGLTSIVPVFLASLLLGLATIVGFTLLIIPAFIVMTIYCLCIPAVIAEKKGPFDSLSRSAELTKGYRWKVFGAGVLAIILIGAVDALFGLVDGTLPIALGDEPVGATVSIPLVIVGIALETAQYLFLLIFAAVLYHQIRIAKEGSSAEEIASVFA